MLWLCKASATPPHSAQMDPSGNSQLSARVSHGTTLFRPSWGVYTHTLTWVMGSVPSRSPEGSIPQISCVVGVQIPYVSVGSTPAYSLQESTLANSPGSWVPTPTHSPEVPTPAQFSCESTPVHMSGAQPDCSVPLWGVLEFSREGTVRRSGVGWGGDTASHGPRSP